MPSKNIYVYQGYDLAVGPFEGYREDHRDLYVKGKIIDAKVFFTVTPSLHGGCGFRLEINGVKVKEITWPPGDTSTKSHSENVYSIVGSEGGALTFTINGFKTWPYPGEVHFNVTVILTIVYEEIAEWKVPKIKWPELPWWVIPLIALGMVTATAGSIAIIRVTGLVPKIRR
ncbi:hypothetical protein J7L81_02710 [Candidatus Aerophobetes bacterium]|nr:hypothetical protein [Candidatus Aerophobetes bacterium]